MGKDAFLTRPLEGETKEQFAERIAEALFPSGLEHPSPSAGDTHEHSDASPEDIDPQ